MICPVCPHSVPNLQSLNVHMKCDHGKMNRDIFICKASGCTRRYNTWKSFKQHATSCPFLHSSKPSTSDAHLLNDIQVENVQSTSVSNVNMESPTFLNSVSFEEFVKASADEFVSKLYSMPKLPRNHVQNIMVHVISLLTGFCSEIKDTVVQTLQDCSAPEKQVVEVQNMFTVVSNPFAHIFTEYHRLKYFSESGVLIQPDSVVIGQKTVSKRTLDGSNVLHPKDCHVQSIPLNLVFKKYFELPDVFSTVTSYLEKLDSNDDVVENFMQCSLWKSKCCAFRVTPECLVLPLFVYFDEVECNNPLGSRSKLLGAVYVSFPFLPPECQSAIDNIFLALLFDNSYRAEFSDAKVFAPLIAQLISLEKEGILISTTSGEKRVYFITSLVIGDNKAVNSILGFVEGFTAHYFCRFCKTKKDVTHTQSVEDLGTLRSERSHTDDINVNSKTETGVKADSVFNKLPSFHVTKNYSVDSFHDLQEGICHYVLIHLLKHCIPKYFTLEELNNRIFHFDHGKCETNKIPLISSIDREKLKMSGSETLLFTRMLGILIGDRVPEDDPFWLLYLKLREILDIVLLKRVPRTLYRSLRVLVEEFNSMYVQVTKDTLKPKMHGLLHYARVLENSGPIDLLSTRRFESKHRSITVPAHATSSRVDICKTAALSHQLHQSFTFISRKSLLPVTTYGPSNLLELSDFDTTVSYKNLPDSLTSCKELLSCNWIEHKGTKYSVGCVLIINANEHGPVFGQLSGILVNDSDVYFMFTYLVANGFNRHLQAYCVESTNVGSCKEPNYIYDPMPLAIHRDFHGEKYVVLRYSVI